MKFKGECKTSMYTKRNKYHDSYISSVTVSHNTMYDEAINLKELPEIRKGKLTQINQSGKEA